MSWVNPSTEPRENLHTYRSWYVHQRFPCQFGHLLPSRSENCGWKLCIFPRHRRQDSEVRVSAGRADTLQVAHCGRVTSCFHLIVYQSSRCISQQSNDDYLIWMKISRKWWDPLLFIKILENTIHFRKFRNFHGSGSLQQCRIELKIGTCLHDSHVWKPAKIAWFSAAIFEPRWEEMAKTSWKSLMYVS